MKKIKSSAFLFCLLFIGAGWFAAVRPVVLKAAAAQTEIFPVYYPCNEVLVELKADADRSSIFENTDFKSVEPVTEQVVLISFADEPSLQRAVQSFHMNPQVKYIQPNYRYDTQEFSAEGISDDPGIEKQWAFDNDGTISYAGITAKKGIDIKLSKAWAALNAGIQKETKLAVVDTGIDYKHEDLSGRLWTNPLETADNGIDDDNNGFIDDVYGWNFYSNNKELCNYKRYVFMQGEYEDDHGTHVAGIINARADNKKGVAGIASKADVKLITAKALGGALGLSKGDGTDTASVTRAVRYAEKMGATICNMSLGGSGRDKILEQTIKESDMLFITASGNGDLSSSTGYDIDKKPVYPACIDSDNIICVANIQCNGTLHRSSNYGKKSVDLAAPGTGIYSTAVNNRYVVMSGTSMAAPMVSGVAALVSENHKDITVKQIKRAILDSVTKLSSLSGKVKTGGMLNAYGAVTYNINAPYMSAATAAVKKSNDKTLTAVISDDQNDIKTVRYEKGKKTASYFNKGTKGTKLTLKDRKVSIRIKKTDTYSIYAIDDEGNETVQNIKVTVQQPQKVSLSAKNKTLKKGKSFTLKASASPKGVYAKFTYKSSNAKIASVGKNGKVTAKKKGKATITVTAQNGKKAACKVTVK